VLLLGVDHNVNTSLHYAEKLVGRKQFVRWALTSEGVVECPGFPGCSHGFGDISTRLEAITREVKLGEGTIQSVPMRDLLHTAVGWIREDPLALLCERPGCGRCQAVRDGVSSMV
jgi:aminoglycoside 3-N-acetyltransferase